MKYCTTCNLEYPDASRFCKVCGKELAAYAVTAAAAQSCPSCGAAAQSGWKFCKECGHSFDEVTVVSARSASPAQAFFSGPTPPAAVTPIAGRAPAAPHAAPPARVEQCRTCGHRNEAGAWTCEACGAPVGSRARMQRLRRAAKIIGTLAACVVLFAGLAAVGWYLLGVRVSVQTDPGDAKLVIDGEEAGRTNSYGSFMSQRLRAGDHNLIVSHDGYNTWRQDFNIGLSDLSKSLNVRLDQTKYKLTVVSSPAGSDVLVDNSPVGKTSAEGGTLETAPLLPGTHVVTVRSDGYREWKQSVNLQKDAEVHAQLSPAPVMDQNVAGVEDEVKNALAGWAQSAQNRDLNEQMRYYADTLDYYYSRTLVPSARVRDDRAKAFQKYNYLSVQLNNINVQPDSTGQRATAVFDKTFDFRGENGAFFQGSVQNQLTLTKLGGAWLITGEKELKVYNVKSSNGT